MPPEAKRCVKPTRTGRMKGVLVPIDQNAWENMLRNALKNVKDADGNPVTVEDCPLEDLRITRYPTNSNTIQVRVRHISKIPIEELDA